ncbi:hypothetical protein ABIE67_006484 [Streptomyces sp. V4I8]
MISSRTAVTTTPGRPAVADGGQHAAGVGLDGLDADGVQDRGERGDADVELDLQDYPHTGRGLLQFPETAEDLQVPVGLVEVDPAHGGEDVALVPGQLAAVEQDPPGAERRALPALQETDAEDVVHVARVCLKIAQYGPHMLQWGVVDLDLGTDYGHGAAPLEVWR